MVRIAPSRRVVVIFHSLSLDNNSLFGEDNGSAMFMATFSVERERWEGGSYGPEIVK